MPVRLWDGSGPVLADTSAWMQAAAIGILHFDQHLARLGDCLGLDAHWISAPP